MNTAELLELVDRLSIDPIFGCYTRAALQYRWTEFSRDAVGVVYLDIDDMHGLNSLYGHAGTDERIRLVISNVRHNDIVSSRWLNGDELVFIIKSGNAKQLAERLQAEFRNVGINATFCYSNTVSSNAEDTINPLDDMVQHSKNIGIKGIILEGSV